MSPISCINYKAVGQLSQHFRNDKAKNIITSIITLSSMPFKSTIEPVQLEVAISAFPW